MANTTTRITDDASWSPFYYLKISGLPYYFFATVDPTNSSKYATPWTGSGGTAKAGGGGTIVQTGTYTAIKGMRIPSAPLEQSIGDLFGGFASPETLRIELPDFDAHDANGNPYKFFGRLFAVGRAQADSSLQWGTLDADLAATATTGLKARSSDTYAAATSIVHVGTEAIQYTGKSAASNVTTFTGLTRQMYPAVDSHGGVSFPNPFYYRVYKDASVDQALPSLQVPVSSQPVAMVGRIAAFFISHVEPTGDVATEAESLLRFVGRIKQFRYRQGMWEIEIASLMDDLATARAAPGLPMAEIKPGQLVVSSEMDTFIVSEELSGTVYTTAAVTVPTGTYNGIHNLVDAINAQLDGITTDINARLHCNVVDYENRIYFTAMKPSGIVASILNLYIRHGKNADKSTEIAGAQPSLLSLLGWPMSSEPFYFERDSTLGEVQDMYAPNRFPSIFFPTVGQSTRTLTLVGDDNPGERFFTDQNDGTSQAWVRLDDGQIVQLTAASAESATLGDRIIAPADAPPYYYVPKPGSGSMEQVLLIDTLRTPKPVQQIFGEIIEGTGGQATALDIYPEGVGLGWAGLLDGEFLTGVNFVERLYIIDSKSTVKDLFLPALRELGLVMVWDTENSQYTLRQLDVPQVGAAETTSFTDSNRITPDDVTEVDWDVGQMRTGVTLKWQYDPDEDKLLEATGYTDAWARSVYNADAKRETIEDKSLVKGWVTSIVKIIRQLADRHVMHKYPWARCRRTVNKRGLLLSPGTVHQVIDATIHNPATGVLGITSANGIYALLTRVSHQLESGGVSVEFMIQSTDDNTLYRRWSPSGLVDFTKNDAGYTNGWNDTTDTLYMDGRWSGTPSTNADGIDFVAGDVIQILSYDNDGALSTELSRTIDSVSSDGQTITLTAGGFTLSTTVETVIMLQPYSNSTTARQGTEAFQGDQADGQIQATADNHKWA